MKHLTAMVCLAATSLMASAQSRSQSDSVQMVHLQEAQVVSTRANNKTPMAFSQLSKRDIAKSNHGQDIPFLLSKLPSVLTTSDAGTGIGYTGLRVRGTDPTRINITTNGIPLNDAESHAVFWVNMGDFASSLNDIQVQRGAGTSTNGAGAFGATINMQTETVGTAPYAELATSFGSFATNKQTVKFGTGLLGRHWALTGRLSHIGSEGYRDRASAELWSYFAQLGYFAPRTSLKFITFGGKETTYHAWDGISAEMLKTDRTFNPNGYMMRQGVFVGYYPDQNDVYRQYHYQLIFNRQLSDVLTLNAALHYTRGLGYYEEYKNGWDGYGEKLVKYGLTPFVRNGATVSYANLIRQKHLDNHFYGGVFSVNYKSGPWEASLGGGINRYDGDHFGKVMSVEDYEGTFTPGQHYYDNTSKKLDGNLYARATYLLGRGLSLYGDVQYRHINYKMTGTNDVYQKTISGMQILDFDETFRFFNPKVGATWQLGKQHKLFASAAVAQREPKRKDFTEGYLNRKPKAERMLDYELGYTFTTPRFNFGVNLYYMDYKDQLVLTGQLNEIGEPVSENVAKSFRRGIELSAGARLLSWLTWEANATLSENKIKNYTGYLTDHNWDNLKGFEVGTTTIAMSPSFMANNTFTAQHRALSISLQTQYVGRQYLDNFEQRGSSLKAYCVSHLSAEYALPVTVAKEAVVGLTVYNLFDCKYETNGYAQTTYTTSGTQTTFNFDPRFYPMAGINFLAHLRVKF